MQCGPKLQGQEPHSAALHPFSGARFTFVYKNTTDGWKIITHHSSALPEPETPKTTVEAAAGRKMLQAGNGTNITSVTVTAECTDNCPGKTTTNQAVGTKATTVRPVAIRADCAGSELSAV
jgi:hypothetical protein